MCVLCCTFKGVQIYIYLTENMQKLKSKTNLLPPSQFTQIFFTFSGCHQCSNTTWESKINTFDIFYQQYFDEKS